MGSSRNKHLGTEIDGAGNGKRLALTARHRADRLCGVAEIDADLQHLVMGDLVHLVHSEVAERPLEFAAHEEVAGHRHQLVQRQVLIDSTDAGIAEASRGERNRVGLPSM